MAPDDPTDRADATADEAQPEWWRQNVEEFRAYDLVPYSPSRLVDGTVTRELIERLEGAHDVTIRLRSINPQEAEGWELQVDGRHVADVERVRTREPEIVYRIDAERFAALVADAAGES